MAGYLGLRSQARFSPGYNIAGLQPSESAYDLSHVGIGNANPGSCTNSVLQVRCRIGSEASHHESASGTGFRRQNGFFRLMAV